MTINEIPVQGRTEINGAAGPTIKGTAGTAINSTADMFQIVIALLRLKKACTKI
jgi:hypothetical protein